MSLPIPSCETVFGGSDRKSGNEILSNTNIRLIEPSASEMINSTLLPDHHKDPFDRLLVAQANQNSLLIVTKDRNIEKYEVETFWM